MARVRDSRSPWPRLPRRRGGAACGGATCGAAVGGVAVAGDELPPPSRAKNAAKRASLLTPCVGAGGAAGAGSAGAEIAAGAPASTSDIGATG